MKRLLILLLSLVLVFSFVACGGSTDTPPETCTKHTDTNGDKKCDTCGSAIETPECTEHSDLDNNGKCDACGAEVEKDEDVTVKLIEDGVCNFKFVIGTGVNSSLRMEIDDLVSALGNIGIETEYVNDTANNVSECEVLIGEIKYRGDEYKFDKYSLGKEGYAVKPIGTKVIISAGDDANLIEAFRLFVSDVLGFDEEGTDELTNVSLSTKDAIIEIQDNYNITSLTIKGQSFKGYTIAVNKRDMTHNSTALHLQDVLYTYTGNFLPIVSLEEKSEKSIVISKVEDDGEYGFKIYQSGTALNIDCGFDNALEDSVKEFLKTNIIDGVGSIDFAEGYAYNKEVRIARYEDFGAVGDGRTDDFLALQATHNYANKGGQTVVAKPGAKYYIHNVDKGAGIARSLTIKTNTVWTGAEFIFDDTSFRQDDVNNTTLIRVSADYNQIKLKTPEEIKTIFPTLKIDSESTTKINWTYGFSAMLIIKNENTKHFIRYPGDANNGGSQQELIEVDKDGNLIGNTAFMFDFDDITEITIIRTDEKQITIKDGTITTYANDTPLLYEEKPYFSRNFSISRSNAVVDGLKHYVLGEEEKFIDGQKRHAYSGFLSVQNCANVRLQNCILTARRYCRAAGTYDFQASMSNNLTLYNVVQHNFRNEDGTPVSNMSDYWGIGGTNYCKNLTYDTCVLSRFDAHEGLYNGKVINSTVNSLEIIGKGEMLVENTTFEVMNGAPVALRSDYGATWNGTVILRNVTYKYCPNKLPTTYAVIGNSWYNHNYGYQCYFPNVELDNFKVENLPEGKDLYLSAFNNTNNVYDPDATISGEPNINPYVPPKYFKVINNEAKLTFLINRIPFFADTEIIGNIRFAD